jgi:hypothetical protein
MWPLDIIWTFARGEETMWLRRGKTDAGLLLIESRQNAPERSYYFGDISALMRFERELTGHLEESGWSVLDFAPERRSGIERRHTRAGQERRRYFQPRIA